MTDLKDLYDKTTQGEWKYRTGPALEGNYHSVETPDEYMVCECHDGGDDAQQAADAQFIAAIHRDFPKIWAVIEAARGVFNDPPSAKDFDALMDALNTLDGDER